MSEWPSIETPGEIHADLVDEGQFYSVATTFVPSWVELVRVRNKSARMSAEALHPTSATVYQPLHFTVPWRCEPELFVKAKPQHPGFNGELKGCPGMVYNEVLTYVVIDMLSSLFPNNGKHRFYSRPPIGYGLVAFPHVGYFLAVEWVGKLFLTPVTKPFLLGTSDHKAAVEGLTDVQYDTFVEVEASGGQWADYTDGEALLVKWTGQPVDNRFYKIVYCEKYDGFGAHGATTRWRDLYHVYSRYSEVVTGESDHPPSLVPARLLFGVSAVLVDMAWVKGTEAKADWERNESFVLQIAAAIVWLAQKKLLYCDARPPNILVEGESAYLIDYDDMIIAEDIPKSYAHFRSQVEQVAEQRGQGKEVYTLSFENAPKLLNKVDELLRSASMEVSGVSLCGNVGSSSGGGMTSLWGADGLEVGRDDDAHMAKKART